jgi:demethylmenaquinone methyltransferase/2-methoxy-6-polyprenyl-1,4-benzoquinol methylase
MQMQDRDRQSDKHADIALFTQSLFRRLPARYDALAYLLSFGQDRRWRAAVVDRVAAALPPSDSPSVLDVACGPAGVTLALAREIPGQVVGVDLTEAMLRRGLANVQRAGASDRVKLAVADARSLPFDDGVFDALSFSYLLRYVTDPQATVAELTRCLTPGGVIACLEFHVPPAPAARAAWWVYTRVLLPAFGLVLGGAAWLRVGRFLGPSISRHYARYPVATQVGWWEAAGLCDVQVRRMSLGGGLVMWARKPPVSR